jgi:hypothetical protein
MFPTNTNRPGNGGALIVQDLKTPVTNSGVIEAVSTSLGPLEKFHLGRVAKSARKEAFRAIAEVAGKALVEDTTHDIALKLQDSLRRREARFAQQGEALMVGSLETRDRTSLRLTDQQERTAEVIENDYDEKLARLQAKLTAGQISSATYERRRAEFEQNRDELLADSKGARQIMTQNLNSGFVQTNSPRGFASD